jgi:hypothetical protein
MRLSREGIVGEGVRGVREGRTSRRRDSGSSPDQDLWDLWCTH